jgi:hypothetical protein
VHRADAQRGVTSLGAGMSASEIAVYVLENAAGAIRDMGDAPAPASDLQARWDRLVSIISRFGPALHGPWPDSEMVTVSVGALRELWSAAGVLTTSGPLVAPPVEGLAQRKADTGLKSAAFAPALAAMDRAADEAEEAMQREADILEARQLMGIERPAPQPPPFPEPSTGVWRCTGCGKAAGDGQKERWYWDGRRWVHEHTDRVNGGRIWEPADLILTEALSAAASVAPTEGE